MAKKRPVSHPQPGAWLERTLNTGFLLAYFTLLPMLCTVLIHWAAYAFTANNLYHQFWMSPTLLITGTFIGGTLIRQKMEDEMGGMGLFTLGMLALIGFAALTYRDIQMVGGVYSQFMPQYLGYGVQNYVYMLPGVGVMGMLFYKFFTVKHYS